MTDPGLDNELRAAFALLEQRAPDPRPYAQIDKNVSSRRARQYLAMAAACVAAAGIAVSIYAVRESNTGTNAVSPPARSACRGAVVTSALPRWARGGFFPGFYVQPHITGASGTIVGVLMANPLRSPPPPGSSNKIVWAAKDPGNGPLNITAHLEGSTQEVRRKVAGFPGPSDINMPAPGCWQLTLTWSGHTDTAALPYAP